ncbi:hypothetical protein CHL67_11285 [Prosthecochloris sp. GSB1]|uniref:hypothetical protein n=1 Tax=Prosthecochloris sp. GSB1 TaxID=281093 RepID=UPI000B8CCD80|nr:hypothetical protein [Prosthecochloris sp. GSB1]ASQ91426.1 hypothetical protein CHL67_11285 [Prosthecochloris sp. GSB1]
MVNSISRASLGALLGIAPTTPLETSEMRKELSIHFITAERSTPRLRCFTASLMNACGILGIRVVDRDEAVGPDGKLKPGIVVIAPGNFSDKNLAINLAGTLYDNIIVGVHDEPPPLTGISSPQEKLDGIVRKLAWDMVHISIYVTADSWTVCTMNGGVVAFEGSCPLPSDVQKTLVPKLTAQVVPPKSSDLDLRPGALLTGSPEMETLARDFARAGRLWENNDYLLTHTSREGLDYRTPFYRKIVARYLDQRSGMSYGFFARQLPCAVPASLPAKEAGLAAEKLEKNTTPLLRIGERSFVPVKAFDQWHLVEPVPVMVVATRSGCMKTRIDPSADLVALRLEGGRVTFITPEGLPESIISRPSFDTLTMLSHALGNSIIASIMRTLRPSWRFPRILAENGASMTHWHGSPDRNVMPEGYFLHGLHNPPVSCSTPQSAAYSLLGKIDALEQALHVNREYRGDIHVEPNHGTNIVGLLSLEETASAINVK